MAANPDALSKTSRRKGLLRSFLVWLVLGVALLWSLAVLIILAARWIDPPTTAVHIERRLEAWIHHKPYHEEFEFVSLSQISPDLQHAVIAAEDARFYQHHGFDWAQVQIAVEDDLDRGKSRGASTITQQLVKNLFLTTSRSWIRKGIEFTIVPITELLLSKKRILELYLNVIEWGPGIYGAEAAGEHYYHLPAARITRDQGIELASILPAPLRRKPGRLTEYDRIISDRMAQMGW